MPKKPTNERAALVNIESSQPLELVCMDYLSLERSNGGYENSLVITDHFTRYAIAIPTRNQTAKTTTEAFFNNPKDQEVRGKFSRRLSSTVIRMDESSNMRFPVLLLIGV
jgi:hypothetical protein